MKLKHRTHHCGQLTSHNIDETVTLNGWINSHRDLGALVFLDIRDRWGMTQVTFDEDETSPEVFQRAKMLRDWDVVRVTGKVRPRPGDMVNKAMKTGEIEVAAVDLKLLNKTAPLPINIDEAATVSEDLRLKYRFLDLRRRPLQEALQLRHRLALSVRNYLDREGFTEVETPFLTRSTPEGARDYVVPSRVHPGRFFALPQSPQLFKQLLMVGGYDRYFQFVKCFRDEDLRADRQPEFTQIDMEMSFVTEEDIYTIVEGMMVEMGKVSDIEVKTPFVRMTYHEAMSRFGSDKPDIRFELELVDVAQVVSGSGFKVFDAVVENGGEIRAIRVPGCAGYSRKQITDLEDVAKAYGAKGLAWVKWTDEGFNSPILKFIGEDRAAALFEVLGGKQGDLALLVADTFETTCTALGAVRSRLAKDLDLIPEGTFTFVWVTDFPMFEFDEEENRWVAVHHPFTAPRPEDMDNLTANPGSVTARAYDIALNGFEIGGGSIRTHNMESQQKVFQAIGIGEEEAEAKFGFLLNALKYGAPPHGGIAFGFDRIAMIFTGQDSIRDVIAFPKTTRAACLMTEAPAEIDDRQLDELGISLKPKPE